MGIDIGESGQKFILIFFRIISVLWLLPFFSSKAIATGYKAGLSMILAFFIFDKVSFPAIPGGDPFYLGLLVIKEMLIGISIGFVVRIIFLSIAVAGEIPALQAGFAFARFMDPVNMSQGSVLEEFKTILAVIIFFVADAHHILIKGLFASFRDLPVGSGTMKLSLLHYLINATSSIFSVGLKLGAPVIVTLFVTELALGMLSRMVPQINIFVEGVPIKILLTLFVLALSMNILIPVIAGMFRRIEQDMLRIIELMV